VKLVINTSSVLVQRMMITYVIITLQNNAIKITVLRHVVLLRLLLKNALLNLITLNTSIALVLMLMNSSTAETLIIPPYVMKVKL
jgi:hypothetical protein